ncbi:biotin/lipoate A/B protein ligase family protein [Chungangia koreensis]|uniref:Octanoyl-[GcvH]:protein N-octanoyltransferase n=1 Tax=Chungangia koreensis TaxID=752657 RepID=A0ABV8X456_9LACT
MSRTKWRYLDQSVSLVERSPLESFAMDDTLCHLVGSGQSSEIFRTWVHDHSVVLGIQDHRLPYLDEAVKVIEQAGYQPIVRNSGGLAVVLDSGVLNVSIVLSEKTNSVDIPAAYEIMVAFIKRLFPEAANEIEAYEIVGSYCPGSYDLSIGGRKFAGISQRRIRSGIAVQIYLCIEGSGAKRAELIREFYNAGIQGTETKFSYPDIQPEVMASLSELIGAELTVRETVARIEAMLTTLGQLNKNSLTVEELKLYDYYLNRLIERNRKLLSE